MDSRSFHTGKERENNIVLIQINGNFRGLILNSRWHGNSVLAIAKFRLANCEGSMYWALLRSHYGYFYHQYWSNITILFYYFIISIDHGRNNFGQDGTLTCNASNPDVGCQGTLFCLPDPYGCSCAAGFIGTNCTSGMSSSNHH